MTRRLKTGVLLSGSGTTLQNLLDRADAGTLPIDVRVVVATKSGARGAERARTARIAAHDVTRRAYRDHHGFSDAVAERLAEHDLDLVLMAGLLHLWIIPERYKGKVMNIHPALIPAFSGAGFYDMRVHEAVIASGVKVSGCTVHFADNQYDHGPIILQKTTPVTFDDTPETLRERIQQLERQAYPEAIQLFADGRLRIEQGRVEILPEPS